MQAEIVRIINRQVDIKIVNGEKMHVLQWRRNLFWDEVLLDGKRQASSHGLWGREKVYGLVFGRDEAGDGGHRLMLIVDPRPDHTNWFGTYFRMSGVRLEAHDGPLISYGSLDPRSMQKPVNFSEWMKKTMGMEW